MQLRCGIMKKIALISALSAGITFADIPCGNACHSALSLFQSVVKYTNQSNEFIIKAGKENAMGFIGAANGMLRHSCDQYEKIPDNEKKAFGLRLEYDFGVNYEIYTKLCELGNINVLLIDEDEYK